ncbi:MAG: NUDIX hydrolase [Actinomycetota bacterium]|nr:NUDIX hydrolase [Actinomycetota bacterium]
MPDSKYEIVNSKEVWRGHIFTIRVDEVRMPAGNVAEREVITHAGAVGVVAVTADREVVLVRQYRHAVGHYLLEIPAGKLDRGEFPAQCARRELREEAGVEFRELIELTEFHNSPGYSSELFHLYMAEVTAIGEMEPDGDEELDMERIIIPLDEALAMIDRREIIDAKSIIGLLMAARRIST